MGVSPQNQYGRQYSDICTHMVLYNWNLLFRHTVVIRNISLSLNESLCVYKIYVGIKSVVYLRCMDYRNYASPKKLANNDTYFVRGRMLCGILITLSGNTHSIGISFVEYC